LEKFTQQNNTKPTNTQSRHTKSQQIKTDRYIQYSTTLFCSLQNYQTTLLYSYFFKQTKNHLCLWQKSLYRIVVSSKKCRWVSFSSVFPISCSFRSIKVSSSFQIIHHGFLLFFFVYAALCSGSASMLPDFTIRRDFLFFEKVKIFVEILLNG
jgi:hypothetical protein